MKKNAVKPKVERNSETTKLSRTKVLSLRTTLILEMTDVINKVPSIKVQSPLPNERSVYLPIGEMPPIFLQGNLIYSKRNLAASFLGVAADTLLWHDLDVNDDVRTIASLIDELTFLIEKRGYKIVKR